MPSLPCIVIYGNTLPLAGIAVALQGREDIQVISIPANCPDEMERLNDLHPDVVLFDLDQIGVHMIFSYLEPDARPVLMGVDANNNHLTVWSGREITVQTIPDLLQMIEGVTGANFA
jgi:hypothetical protein